MAQRQGTAVAAPSLWLRVPLIQAGALAAESVTFPVDSVKTQYQARRHGEGYAAVAISALKQRGVRGLYGGLVPAVLRHWVYTATRIVLYEDLRNQLGGGAESSFAAKAACGFTAGAIGQLIASPFDLVKVGGSFHALLRARASHCGWELARAFQHRFQSLVSLV